MHTLKNELSILLEVLSESGTLVLEPLDVLFVNLFGRREFLNRLIQRQVLIDILVYA